MVFKKIRLLLPVLLLSSCSFLEPRLQVFSGNYSFQKGHYQEALINYIKALDSGNNPDFVYYNMGNVYYALGEEESALGIWENAAGSADDDIQFRLTYNLGILYFQQGLYNDAYKEFRKALILNPSSRDAKINLEQAFYKKSALESRKPVEGDIPPAQSGELSADDTERLMQYIILKEENVWESSQEIVDTDIPDW